MKACMGGWCSLRDKCPHYTEAPRIPQAAERLCLPGKDGQRAVHTSPFRLVVVDVLQRQEVAE